METTHLFNLDPEWLETDGAGGFAMGSLERVPQRRYHALLIHAENPPIDRYVYLKHLEVILECDDRTFNLSNFFFCDPSLDLQQKTLTKKAESFPFPYWEYSLAENLSIGFELFISKSSKTLNISWELIKGLDQFEKCVLKVRPLLSGLDMHVLQRTSSEGCWFESSLMPQSVSFSRADSSKELHFLHNAIDYHPLAIWYHNFYYTEEKRRGYDYLEDLYSPGILEFDLTSKSGILSVRAQVPFAEGTSVADNFESLKAQEYQLRGSQVEKGIQHFLVSSKNGKSIIAGYPWFTDWGRDTFIALRGLFIAQGLYSEAEEIILRWMAQISDGMIPNRFPDQGEVEYNAVDASLWFIVAVYELIQAADLKKFELSAGNREQLLNAIDTILEFYTNGTRFNIHATADGLIYSGAYGYALTWMDARFNGQPITQRSGKPVEIQALWINALEISNLLLNKRSDLLERAKRSFVEKFWNSETECLFDVIYDSEFTNDAKIRPNQIFAVGGLPFAIVPESYAKSILAVVSRDLLTAYGLRTLAKNDPDFYPIYMGTLEHRDKAYHQGSVWAWLMGAYCEAHLRVFKFSEEAKQEVQGFLKDIETKFMQSGQSYEVQDAVEPFVSGGCPFQAWSLGEYLRIKAILNNDVITKLNKTP
jgi:predicted glycogen debranching enzyme